MMIGSVSYVCGDECESVVHVLWECPAYDTIRSTFMEDLDKLLQWVEVLKSLVHSIISRGRALF